MRLFPDKMPRKIHLNAVDMLPITEWKLPGEDSRAQRVLQETLGVQAIISKILVNRDIADPEEAKKFLYPALKDLHNPFLMKDIDKGVDRVIDAIFKHERIAVFGDYDADGITSVVALIKFFESFPSNITYYIPDRLDEGYGLNRGAIDRLKKDGVSLIVTVDCGITDVDEVEYAKSIGIDTIILDHHEVPERLPDAVASINPNRTDCHFPFKHLAGVGIVFNFLIALRGKLRNLGFWYGKQYPNLKEYLDIVALGTIGDIAPLVDENRIFARIGLELIDAGQRVGIRALKEKSNLGGNRAADARTVSFQLIPRINAAGRVGSPEDAVRLLLTDNMEEALHLAALLDFQNRERQEMERKIVTETIQEIEKKLHPEEMSSIVLASSDWHPGVIGIVASRLVEKYYRPSILISLKDGVGKGSGRSISEFNLYEGLREKCDSLLLSYGGHRYAAGITIREEDIPHFADILNEAVAEEIDISRLLPKTYIDAECTLTDIDRVLLHQIDLLSPFGNMNPEPVLCIKNIHVASMTTVGGNHLRMRVTDDSIFYDSIWFGKGHVSGLIAESLIDIAFTPQINLWNGMSNIQLKMKDIAPSSIG